MVVGTLLEGQSQGGEFIESELYPVIQGLHAEQRVYVESGSSGLEREIGLVSSAGAVSMVFMPTECREDGSRKPWQVIDADRITSGEVEVLVEPNLFTPEDLELVPVGTNQQIEIARQYGTKLENIARWVGKGLLVKTSS